MITVSDNLKNLAKLTDQKGSRLYIVGGYVRNMLLGYSSDDIDIAGSLLVEDMEKLCQDNGYKVSIVNKRLGTLLISIDSEQYEYTTFRSEIYDDTGKHVPDKVKFVTDPKVDALRRDFTVNAIYYDILNNSVHNYFDSINDLKKHRLVTVVDPKIVFNDDGLRILRMVRLACELNFKPDRKTYKSAIEYSYNVKDISKERILREIQISVNGGLKYLLKNQTHGNLIKYYNRLKLWKYIFGATFSNFKVKPHGVIYKAYLESDGSFRYIAFMCLVLYNFFRCRQNDANLGFAINLMLGTSGLKSSNKSIKDIYDAYHFLQKILYDSPKKFLTAQNCLIYENLSFEIDNYLAIVNPKKISKLKELTLQLKRDEIPFRELDLKIDATTMIEKAHVNPKFISKIKNTLFEMCVKRLIRNEPDELINNAKILNARLESVFKVKDTRNTTQNEISTDIQVNDGDIKIVDSDDNTLDVVTADDLKNKL